MKKTTLETAVELLKKGGIVAFPTETVYGLGADARNPDAVKKIFEKKGRPFDNPLIVHISSRGMVKDFASEIPAEAEQLMKAFWPGPLTLIFKKKSEVLDSITAGLPTVALRWPSHPISQDLIARAGPLVAPSANSSGRPSPTKPEHVLEDFGDDFPLIEAGETQIGLESTVLDVSASPFQIFRPGFIGKSQIEKIIGRQITHPAGNSNRTPKSPGTKYSHYAPHAKVRWLKPDEKPVINNTMYLFHDNNPEMVSDHIIFYQGDYSKMAHELYDRFRQADHREISQIIIEPFSEQIQKENAIAEALVNRISKAISK